MSNSWLQTLISIGAKISDGIWASVLYIDQNGKLKQDNTGNPNYNGFTYFDGGGGGIGILKVGNGTGGGGFIYSGGFIADGANPFSFFGNGQVNANSGGVYYYDAGAEGYFRIADYNYSTGTFYFGPIATSTSSIFSVAGDINFGTDANSPTLSSTVGGSYTVGLFKPRAGNQIMEFYLSPSGTQNETILELNNASTTSRSRLINYIDGALAGIIVGRAGGAGAAQVTTLEYGESNKYGDAIGSLTSQQFKFNNVSTLTLNSSGDGLVFNDAQADLNFRVESDTEDDLFFIDAGDNSVNIRNSNTSLMPGDLNFGQDLGLKIALYPTSTSNGYGLGIQGNNLQLLVPNGNQEKFTFNAGNTSSPTIYHQLATAAGSESVFNELGANIDTRIEGDTDQNLFFADASTDRVGIGTASPSVKLDVNGVVKGTGLPRTIHTNVTAVNTVGSNAWENVMSYSIPANTLTANGDMITFDASVVSNGIFGSWRGSFNGTSFGTFIDLEAGSQMLVRVIRLTSSTARISFINGQNPDVDANGGVAVIGSITATGVTWTGAITFAVQNFSLTADDGTQHYLTATLYPAP